MIPYLALKWHLERHAYKRGQYKGDAPADASRRFKNDFRVVRSGDKLCVKMYNTHLIEVTPDNKVRISMGGWWTSTTKANINQAMRQFLGWGAITTCTRFSHRQLQFIAKGKAYRYYDGMEFNAEGELLSPPQFFEAKRVDSDQTQQFRQAMKDSGFTEVWPVLFSSAEPNSRWWGWTDTKRLTKIVTEECHANEWAYIAAYCAWAYDDHKAALQAIVRRCTESMYNIVPTDVTVL